MESSNYTLEKTQQSSAHTFPPKTLPQRSNTNVEKSSIVAVHGLNGDAHRTWTSEKTNVSWLSDAELLPRLLPNARVLTFGYNANVTALLGSTSSDRILQHAHTLVADLVADRSVRHFFTPPLNHPTPELMMNQKPDRRGIRTPHNLYMPFPRRDHRQEGT